MCQELTPKRLRAGTRMTLALAIIICGLFYFLFYTQPGLMAQVGAALQIQRVYLRFLTARAKATNGFFCQSSVAQQLHYMSFDELLAAKDVTDAAIALRPDVIEFSNRANIELRLLSYGEAASDFERALALWKQGSGGTFDFDPIGTSNHVEMARAFAEAKEKYSRFSKRPPANPPPPSEQVTNAEAQSKGPKSQ